MADDQTPKTMDINDLVRELSKSSTNPVAPTPPLAPSTQAPRPISPTPKPPMSPPMAGLPTTPSSPAPKPFVPPVSVPAPVVPPAPKPTEFPGRAKAPSQEPTPREMPRPQFNVPPQSFSQPKPAPAPSSVTPPPISGVKEYQSSIRTMNEDISNIKQGQKPAGINIPRKVEQAIPTPQPVVPKPAVPGQQFKVPNVNLGESQKTGPLAQLKDVPRPLETSDKKPQIYIPEAGSKGGNRNVLFLGIGAVALVAGFSYWFFVLRAPAPEIVIETPTPTPTETPVPTPTPTLSSIFSGAQKENIIIKQVNPLSSFVSDTGKIVVDPGAFKMLNAIDTQTPSISYGFVDLSTKLALKIPVELTSNIGNDSAVFLYGQKESFDSKGNLLVGSTASNRIVAVVELKEPSGASGVVTKWETSLGSDFKTLFTLGKASKEQLSFSDNFYRNSGIRFWNFPYADRTIDYSIIVASNGKTYFVITNSREAIFGTIDKLKGF